MPRFFFHRTDGFVDTDTEGTECADENVARAQAIIFAGESLRDNPGYIWDGQDLRVEMTDAGGRLLFTVVALAINAQAAAEIRADHNPGS